MNALEDLFFFEANALVGHVQRSGLGYQRAVPFPHAIFDDFLPQEVAERIADEFPDADCSSFRFYPFPFLKQSGLQDKNFAGVTPFLRHILNEFNGKVFLDFLQWLTGIEGLIPDPHFSGGAIHQILPGGKLPIHADFNWDARRRLDRRINVLVYFNRDWREDYGGHLELWNSDMTRQEVRIAPLLNRCVIFDTTSTSYHGHPDPLTCPPGRTRNSIALYYYSNGRPEEEKRAPHNTLWQQRPHETSRNA